MLLSQHCLNIGTIAPYFFALWLYDPYISAYTCFTSTADLCNSIAVQARARLRESQCHVVQVQWRPTFVLASFLGLSRFYVRLVHAKHEREEKFEKRESISHVR